MQRPARKTAKPTGKTTKPTSKPAAKAKRERGAPDKNLAAGRLVKFPEDIDQRLIASQKETGAPIVERIRRAVARDLEGGIPVLGIIPCGPLEEELASAPRRVDPGNALKWLPGDFFLKAAGDSMAPRIEEGDLVLIRRDVAFNNGEICAVRVAQNEDGEGCKGSLKKVFVDPEAARVTLKSINEKYAPIVVDAKLVTIVGVFRGAIVDGEFT